VSEQDDLFSSLTQNGTGRTLRSDPIGEIDDRTLVAAAQAGDRDALDRLLRRHYDRIHAVCRRIAGGSRDADDAAQEAMIGIVRGLPRFDGRSAFSTWVYRIATNAALDELRRRKRRPHLSAVDDGERPLDIVDVAASGRLEAVAERMAIDDALEQLGDEFRAAVVLRDVADLDYAEIAEVLDVPVGTVKSRIARGRGQLADLLGNHPARLPRPTDDPPHSPTAAP
jgi:RNA polymerase sigma-70 factor, ECF subfamily